MDHINKGKLSYKEYLKEYERKMQPLREARMKKAKETIRGIRLKKFKLISIRSQT